MSGGVGRNGDEEAEAEEAATADANGAMDIHHALVGLAPGNTHVESGEPSQMRGNAGMAAQSSYAGTSTTARSAAGAMLTISRSKVASLPPW